MKKNICIGISGINATDNPGPGVAVARSLREKYPNIQLIGLSYDVHDPGNYLTDLFENSFLLPYPTHGWEKLHEAIKRIATQTQMNTLIPCLDAELPLLIRNQSLLEKEGIQMLLPTESQFDLRSKDRLTDLCEKINCSYPKTQNVNSIDELVQTLPSDFIFPVVVKGKYYKAYIVHHLDEAILKSLEITREWGFPILIQKLIYGKEINLVGLGDGNGNLLGQVSIKKQLTTHLGKVWTAVTIHDEKLDQLAKKFCNFTQWKGPFELECIKTESEIFMIEINPRFPAWVYFATGVGINLPYQLVELLTQGKMNPCQNYPAGKYLVRQTSEFVTDLTYFQNLLSKYNREGL